MVYLCDTGGAALYKVTNSSGILTLSLFYSAPMVGGPGGFFPSDIAFDGHNNLFVSSFFAQTPIRQISPSGALMQTLLVLGSPYSAESSGSDAGLHGNSLRCR